MARPGQDQVAECSHSATDAHLSTQGFTTLPFTMSDGGRKDFTTQAKEKLTPQQEKSTGEKLKEGVTGTADKAGKKTQPESEKGVFQKAKDAVVGE
ncbi:hypothetical protein WJX73_002220 [Symbiochloris irregularis]|uniref:Uncharacterized protein n=1 Tax=Symbiochloris irregularis TaxID=706552 RepID=A0AAW1NXP8_9CHLO